MPGQTEIGEAHMMADEQDVVGFDVAVQHILFVQVIERLRGFAEVAEQLVDGNATLFVRLTLFQAFAQAAVGQVHDDVQLVLLRPGRGCLDEEVVIELLDDLQGAFFADAFLVIGWPGDDLDGRGKAAGRGGAPDFAEAAAANEFFDRVAAADYQRCVSSKGLDFLAGGGVGDTYGGVE